MIQARRHKKEVDVKKVECECGKYLSITWMGIDHILVPVCLNCHKKAVHQAYIEGKKDGYKEGYKDRDDESRFGSEAVLE